MQGIVFITFTIRTLQTDWQMEEDCICRPTFFGLFGFFFKLEDVLMLLLRIKALVLCIEAA